MFRDADDFLAHRTGEAEVDIEQYRNLLRWLTFIATKGDHDTSYGKKDLPQLTWDCKRSDEDIMLSIDSFPRHPDKGLTHIQLFTEGHPTYSPVGISAIVGTRDDEGFLKLCVLSTDGEKAWANVLRTGSALGTEAFIQLDNDFRDIQV